MRLQASGDRQDLWELSYPSILAADVDNYNRLCLFTSQGFRRVEANATVTAITPKFPQGYPNRLREFAVSANGYWYAITSDFKDSIEVYRFREPNGNVEFLPIAFHPSAFGNASAVKGVSIDVGNDGRLALIVTAVGVLGQGPFYQRVFRANADGTDLKEIANFDSQRIGGMVDIAVGPNNDIFVLVLKHQIDTGNGEAICRIKDGGEITEVVYLVGGNDPKSIDVNAEGNLWFSATTGVYRVVPTPSKATLITPKDTITDNTPTYQWNAVPTATWYYLWVNDSTGVKLQQWYTAEQAGCADGVSVCAVTPSKDITNGAATGWIQTWNAAGYGPWSDPLGFTVNGSLPPVATLIAPTGTIPDPNPTYTWNALPTASWYFLWVNDSKGTKIKRWYTAEQAGCAAGTGVCAVTPCTPSQDLANGSATGWIQTWNINGYGPWGAGLKFTVNAGPPPAAPIGYAPLGAIFDPTPTYQWNAVLTASLYYLRVNDSTATKIMQWYTCEQAGCATGTGVCAVTPSTPLTNGAGQWWIYSCNINGCSPWSTGWGFTVNGSLPPAATLIAPTGAITDNTPTYQWNAVPTASWYYLWVNDSTGTTKIKQWYTAEQAGCAAGTGVCTVTPSTPLNKGAGQWWIETWNGNGNGPWSTPADFIVQ